VLIPNLIKILQFLTFTEEHRPRVFEKRGLKKTLGIKSDEVTGDWRKLHIEELHDLFCSSDILVIRSRRFRRNIYLEFCSKI